VHVSLLHIFLPNGQVKVLGNVEKQTDRQTESKTEGFVGKGGGDFCVLFLRFISFSTIENHRF